MNLGTVTSYNVPDNARDVSRAFYLLNFPETPFLNSIAAGGDGDVKNKNHSWWDDVRPPAGTTLGAAYTAGSGTLTVADTSSLRKGSIIKAGASVFRVADVNEATKALAVVPISGDANQLIGETVQFLNNARTEASTPDKSDYTPPVERDNVTQIMDDVVSISGTDLAIDKETTKSTYMTQVKQKLARLYYELGRIVWVNPKVKPANQDDPRLMGGVEYYIHQFGNVAAGAFSLDNLDAWIQEHMLAGIGTYGVPELWIHPNEMANFTALNTSRIRTTFDDKRVGTMIADEYISKHGHVLKIRPDYNKTPGEIALLSTGGIELKALKGRQFHIKPLNEDRDAKQSRILGEYTLKVQGSAEFGIYQIV